MRLWKVWYSFVFAFLFLYIGWSFPHPMVPMVPDLKSLKGPLIYDKNGHTLTLEFDHVSFRYRVAVEPYAFITPHSTGWTDLEYKTWPK